MSKLLFLVLIASALACAPAFASGEPSHGATPRQSHRALILVIGSEGLPRYGESFRQAAQLWKEAAETGGMQITTIGLDAEEADISDHERLQQALTDRSAEQLQELWLVLIGHGTFDGRTARFNLRGPDASAADLAQWLEPFQCPLAILNCSSTSGAFMEPLSAPERVIVTATKSGHEHNYSHFGEYLAQSIADPSADLDKDGQTSLLEGFLTASRLTKEFYTSDGRLETEHALLDDDGNGQGSRADWFRGIRPIRQSADASLDGYRAHQFHLVPSFTERQLPPELRQRRDELELQVAHLRDRKADIIAGESEDAYYAKLELLLIELARIYAQVDESTETASHAAVAPLESPRPIAPPPLPRTVRGK